MPPPSRRRPRGPTSWAAPPRPPHGAGRPRRLRPRNRLRRALHGGFRPPPDGPGPGGRPLGSPRDEPSIFKANDIRGVTVGTPSGTRRARGPRRRVRRRPSNSPGARSCSAGTCGRAGPRMSAAFVEGALSRRERRRRGSGQHGRAVVRVRVHAPARRSVHRDPQPGRLQRRQVLPAGRPPDRAGADDDPAACRALDCRGPPRGPGTAPRTCWVPMPHTCTPGRPHRAAPPEGRRGRGQRHGRLHTAGVFPGARPPSR